MSVIESDWIGSVGTGSDSVPPNATRRALPSNMAEGGHAIQSDSNTDIISTLIEIL